MTEAFICDAVRTPIGRYAGALSSIRADNLAAIPIKALIDRNPAVDWGDLDDVILGCANQAGEDNRNLARMAGLLAGLPVSSGGVTLNRLCGSGLDAVAMASRAIRGGMRKGGEAGKCVERYHCCMQTGEFTAVTASTRAGKELAHDPEKRVAGFPRDTHGTRLPRRSCAVD